MNPALTNHVHQQHKKTQVRFSNKVRIQPSNLLERKSRCVKQVRIESVDGRNPTH